MLRERERERERPGAPLAIHSTQVIDSLQDAIRDFYATAQRINALRVGVYCCIWCINMSMAVCYYSVSVLEYYDVLDDISASISQCVVAAE